MIVRRVRSRQSAAMKAVKAPLIGIAASLLIVLVPGVATAQGPEFERYTYHGSFVDSDLCGFDLHITWRFHARATIGRTRQERRRGGCSTACSPRSSARTGRSRPVSIARRSLTSRTAPS